MEEIRNIISEEVSRIFEEEEPKTVETLQRELNSLYVFTERMENELSEANMLLVNLYDKISSEISEKDSEMLLREVFQEIKAWRMKA